MKILVAGSGVIGKQYLKVLLDQQFTPVVVGRGEINVSKLQEEFPQIEAYSGGLENWLADNEPPTHAIVALPIDNLADATELLLQAGVSSILAEKPLTYSVDKASELAELADRKNARVYVAFNRRSYISVQEAKKLIERDGGVQSFHFDFTEAIFRIDEKKFTTESQKHWGIANSSHVIDTAFYLGGKPSWMECRQKGNAINWHPAGSIFTGIGETETGVPFTYHANWGCPGKWNIEIMTLERKLFFSPMERLHQQLKSDFKVNLIDLDYSLDIDYKPGFYHQVQAYIEGTNDQFLIKTEELVQELNWLNEIFRYGNY